MADHAGRAPIRESANYMNFNNKSAGRATTAPDGARAPVYVKKNNGLRVARSRVRVIALSVTAPALAGPGGSQGVENTHAQR